MRKSIALVLAAVAFAVAPRVANSEGAAPAQQPLNCEIGPITKSYGGTSWHVFSCDDDRTLVIAAVEGSAAAPFYFILFPEESGYRLHGEGTGNRDATSAAHLELAVLSVAEIEALITETKSH